MLVIVEFSASASFSGVSCWLAVCVGCRGLPTAFAVCPISWHIEHIGGINGLETRTLTISPESNCTFIAFSIGFLRSMTVKTFATSRIVLLAVLGCMYFGCPTRHAMRSRPSSLKNRSGTFLSSNQIGADDSSGFVGMTPGSHLSTNIVWPSICHKPCFMTWFLVEAFEILNKNIPPSSTLWCLCGFYSRFHSLYYRWCPVKEVHDRISLTQNYPKIFCFSQ